MAGFIRYNPNPFKRNTIDCVFRALTLFLGFTWREAVDDLVGWAADRGLVNFCYRSTDTAYLKDKGYPRCKAPRKGMTVVEFCDEFVEKGYIYIIQVRRHWTVVSWSNEQDFPCIFDTWYCGDRVVEGFWMRKL